MGHVMTGRETTQWFIARDGKQTGPISDAEIEAIAAHGYFRPSDLIWRAGFEEWQPALSVFPPAPAVVEPPQQPPALPASPPPQPASDVTQPTYRAARLDNAAPTTAPIATDPAPYSASHAREQQSRHDQNRASSATHPAATQNPASSANAPTRGLQARLEPHIASQPGSPSGPSVASSPSSALPAAQPTSALKPLPDRSGGPEGPRLSASPPYRDPAADDQQRQRERGSPAFDPALRVTTREGAAPHRQPSGLVPERDPGLKPPRRSSIGRTVLALAAVLLLVGGGFVALVPNLLSSPVTTWPKIASERFTQVTASMNVGTRSPTAELDTRWQTTAHWPVIKREFPDWYGERLREAAQLASENKTDDEINKVLVDSIITLRRQNANQALAASTPKLVALANAFLENLRRLKAQSTTSCFNFISQGEGTPGIMDQLASSPDGSASPMQLQVAAIFEAIGDGRKSPVTHDKPVKADYDSLMDQLSKLGWTQQDVRTFADPKALAQTEPARVCQMVQDWFIAHVSITDGPTQERLLGETLRPVVSG